MDITLPQYRLKVIENCKRHEKALKYNEDIQKNGRDWTLECCMIGIPFGVTCVYYIWNKLYKRSRIINCLSLFGFSFASLSFIAGGLMLNKQYDMKFNYTHLAISSTFLPCAMAIFMNEIEHSEWLSNSPVFKTKYTKNVILENNRKWKYVKQILITLMQT